MSEKNQNPGLVYGPEDVPEGLSDEEQIRFWETHEVTEEFLAQVEEAPEDERPRPRTGPITCALTILRSVASKPWRNVET